MNLVARLTCKALACLVLALPTASVAADKIPRIGILRGTQQPDPFLDAFWEEMRGLGYEAGRTITYVTRWAEGNPERVPVLARELAAEKVDLIVTGGDNAVQAARDAMPNIPIVMGASNDPVGAGFAESLARPGGQVTGLTILSQELSQKRLEVFQEAVPGLSRVAVLYNPGFPGAKADLASTEAAGRALGMGLNAIPVSATSDIEAALTRIGPEHVDGLITLADPLFTAHRSRLSKLALARRLPTMFHWREFVQEGGLMSYGPDNVALYRRAAHFVDRILKGAKAGDLPIEQPVSFVLGLNLQTARGLGLDLPASLVNRADEVIE